MRPWAQNEERDDPARRCGPKECFAFAQGQAAFALVGSRILDAPGGSRRVDRRATAKRPSRVKVGTRTCVGPVGETEPCSRITGRNARSSTKTAIQKVGLDRTASRSEPEPQRNRHSETKVVK